jgi:AP2 domain-containing protein/homing endonuclease-like protein
MPSNDNGREANDNALFTAGDLRRFWEKVNKSDLNGCWTWTGARHAYGYGWFRFRGKMILAHRASVMIRENLELTADECACHHCDNPPCVRPDHLFIGSKAENAADKVSKGRHAFGKNARNTTGYLGVTWHRRIGKFQAKLTHNWKTVHLGYFDDPIEAARAYDRAAIKLRGSKGALNFPGEYVNHG